MSSRLSAELATSEPDVWEPLSSALRESAPYRSLLRSLGSAARLPVPAAAWVTGLLAKDLERSLLVVVSREADAYAWLEAARLFSPDLGAVYFPTPSLSPYQEAEISLLVRAEESAAVDRIASGRARVVLCTARALFRRLPEPREFRPAAVDIEQGEETLLDELIAHLVRFGYRRKDLVVEVGEFAVRGGVFDFFPPGESGPVRLDLFGDTVESIFRFEPESQRSTESLERVRVLPLSLFACGAEEAVRLADLLTEHGGLAAGDDAAEKIGALRAQGAFDGWEHYLPALASRTVTLLDLLDRPLLVTLDLEALEREAVHHDEILQTDFAARREHRRLAMPPEALEHDLGAVLEILRGAELRVGDLYSEQGGAADFEGSLTEKMPNQLQRFPREVETATVRGQRVLLVVAESERPRIAQELEAQELRVGPGGVELTGGELQRGFRLPPAGVTVFGERQLFRRSPLARNRKQTRYGPFLSSLRDLKVGDFIVHSEHGIGQFVGLRKLGEEGAAAEGLPPELRSAAPSSQDAVEVMEIVYGSGRRLLLPLHPDRPDPEVQRYRRCRPEARSARRNLVDEDQEAHQEGDARHGPGALEAVRRAPDRQGAGHAAGQRPPVPVRGRLRARRDRRSAGSRRGHQEGHGERTADGPAAVRRRRLRQDRGRHAGGLQGGGLRLSGRGPGADHDPGGPASGDLPQALLRLSGDGRDGLPFQDAGPGQARSGSGSRRESSTS